MADLGPLAVEFINRLDGRIHRMGLPHNSPNLRRVYINNQRWIDNMEMWRACIEESPVPAALTETLLRFVFRRLIVDNSIAALNQQRPNAVRDRARVLTLHMVGRTQPCIDRRTRFMTISRAILFYILIPMKNRGRWPRDIPPIVVPAGGRTQRDEATFKRPLFDRDGYNCPITGSRDRSDTQPINGLAVSLIGAHIIPFSSADRPEVHTMLEWFSSGTVQRAWTLNRGINDPYNGLLLQSDAHDDFDYFRWGIQCPANAPGTYHPVMIQPGFDHLSFVVPAQMQFGLGANNNLPLAALPKPELCNLHYAVGKVLRRSGAAEVIDRYFEDLDRDEEGVTAPGKTMPKVSDVEVVVVNPDGMEEEDLDDDVDLDNYAYEDELDGKNIVLEPWQVQFEDDLNQWMTEIATV